MSDKGELPGVSPLTRADIPDLVRAVVAEMKKTTDDPPPGKSLTGTEARSQSSRDDQRARADRQSRPALLMLKKKSAVMAKFNNNHTQ